MELQDITNLQKEYGFSEMQESINSGLCWKMEGSVGRAAMDAIKAGACMLGEEGHNDYWGNYVPSRSEVKEGTKGSVEFASKFWSDPSNYEDC